MEEVTETAQAFRIDTMVREYHRLTTSISANTKAKDTIKALLVNEINMTGEPICVEGLPPLGLNEGRSTGEHWDSDAIRNIIENRPHEWRKLVELGCVKLDGKAIREAVQRGQLAGKPPGGVEGRSEPFLEWEKQR